jgi:uncharacterized damage-inducible protein DinB
MDPGLPFESLLAYNADETAHWKRWFIENPAAVDLACDVAGAGSVRKLLLHIFATELFFADRVLDMPKADYDNLPHDTLDELFAIHESAHQKFQEFLAKATMDEWSRPVSLGFRDFKASKRKMVAQAIWHGINHRGQLTTFLRQQGFKTGWTHDILASKAMQ